MQITNIGILDKIYISVLSLLYFQTLTHSKNEQFWINGNTRITTQMILARWPHLKIILVPVSPRLIWRSDEIPKFYTYKAFSRYNAFSENMIRLWCKLLTGKKTHQTLHLHIKVKQTSLWPTLNCFIYITVE